MNDPIEIFKVWYEAAQNCGLTEPTAMSLATADKNGKPSVRIVLLKKFGEEGFTFFTNYDSRKGKELLDNPFAALCFYWGPLKKQVRIEGHVYSVTREEADEYFNSRHPESRRGAIASMQSQSLPSRDILIDKVKQLEQKYPDDNNIPRPENWSGFRLEPSRIEFWQEGEFRLHERMLFEKTNNGWRKSLLYP